jgi:hypothetical protein
VNKKGITGIVPSEIIELSVQAGSAQKMPPQDKPAAAKP